PSPAPPLFPYTMLFRSPAPNDVFGSGRINALAAADKTIPGASGMTSETVSGNVPTGATVPLSGIGFTDPNQCPLTFNWTGACGTDRKSTRLNSSHVQIS